MIDRAPGVIRSLPPRRGVKTWLAAQPIGRFSFTFTPTHGSRPLNDQVGAWG
jgi:hypothetical protein